MTFWTEPFPNVVSPTRMARCKSLSGPDVADLEWAGQLRIQQPGAFDALHFYLRALQRVFLDLLGRRPQQRERHFMAGRSTQNIDRILQLHSFRGSAVYF